MSYQGRRPRVLQLRAAEIAVELTTVATSGAINNQAVADTSGIRFSAATSITGFVAPSAPVDNGKTLIVANVSTAELVIANESASSTAANRIITGTDSDVTLQPGMALELFYDTTTDRWRIKGGTGGGSGAGTGIRNYLQDWWDGTKSVGTVSTTGDNAGVTDRSASFKQWATSDNTKVTVVQDTGTLRGTKGYKIDSLASGSDVFVETPIFKLDAIDKGNGSSDKQIAVSFDVGGLSSDTAWYVYVRTWNGSYVLQSTKIITEGGEEQFGLAPNGSYLPICNTSNIYKRNFTIYFQPNTGLDYYSVLFRRVSGSNTDDISLSSIFVGPKLLVENMADSQAGASFGSTSIETFGKSPLEGSTLNRALYSEPNYIAAWYMGNKKIGQVVDGVGNSIGSSTRTASTLNRKKWGSSNTTQTSVSREDSNTSNTLRGENGQGAINITNPASGSDVFIESPLFYISSVDLGKPMMIQFDYSNGNTNAVHDVLVARYNSSGVLQELMPVTGGVGGSTGAPVSALLGKDGFKGQFTGFFIPTSTSNDQYALRIRRTIGAISAVNVSIASLYIGRQKTTQGNAITDVIAVPYSAGNFTSNSGSWDVAAGDVNNYQYQRVGNQMVLEVGLSGIAVTGTVSELYLKIPDGKTAGVSTRTLTSFNDNGTLITVIVRVVATESVVRISKLLGGNFSTVANNSDFSFQFIFPIAEWSSNITMADRAVEEFAYNTSTSTTVSDTTSFASGASGAQIQNITAALSRRVRFQTPIQPTDSIVLEIRYSGSTVWQPVATSGVDTSINGFISPWVLQNANEYGLGRLTVQNSTDVDVRFGTYCYPTGATYGAAGQTWSNGSPAAGSAFWRVRKVSAGALVGYGAAKAPTITTLTTGSGTYTTPAGAVRLRVRMVGGGGGGGGTTNSTGGGNTTFGTLTANGGNGTSGTTAGAGGNAVAVGAGFSGISLVGSSGGAGTAFNGTNNLIYAKGGDGGPSAFGGQGGGGDSNVTGGSGGTNTGSGGGGGGIKNIGSNSSSGAGGGSGSYVDVISVGTLASTYSYSVGSGGTGGGTNTNVYGGGNGGSGIIIVEEFYI